MMIQCAGTGCIRRLDQQTSQDLPTIDDEVMGSGPAREQSGA